jgi:hypothetical protein
MGKSKSAEIDWLEIDAGVCETFGRLDAWYNAATGRRLERSKGSFEIVQGLMRGYSMSAIEGAWAWWMREPDLGRDCREPLVYFADEDVLDDIYALAVAEQARSRLLALVLEFRQSAGGPEGEKQPVPDGG